MAHTLQENSPSLLANTAQQELTEQFALYLRQYPDLQIFYQDCLISPEDVERSVTDYPLEFVRSSDSKIVTAVLTIIEWNTDMERNLYLCDAFGFALETTRAGIHAPGFQFTAYLKSDYFSELAEAQQLLPEFNSDIIDIVDEARLKLKQHFRNRAAEAAAEIVEEWIEEDVTHMKATPPTLLKRLSAKYSMS